MLTADSSTPAGLTTGPPDPESREQVYQTSEGPVVITTRGKLVFVAESFPLDLGRKLTSLILDAQGVGELHLARATEPASKPTLKPLTGSLHQFFSECGVMKVAAEAAYKAGTLGAKSRNQPATTVTTTEVVP